MNEILNKLKYVKNTLEKCKVYSHAAHVVGFDLMTIAPKNTYEEQSNVEAFLANEAFKLVKKKKFVESYLYLNDHLNELDELDRKLIESLYKDYEKTKNVTPKLNLEINKTLSKSYCEWKKAKELNDYNHFKPYLRKSIDARTKLIKLRDNYDRQNIYNNMLDLYEKGMSTDVLDKYFNELKIGLIDLIKKIKNSSHKVRTDFLDREVPIYKQEEFSRYVLELQGFSFDRGAIATTEHPFSTEMGKDDVRVTTHYYTNNFISNWYSVAHEGGHAIFGQNIPEEIHSHFLEDEMTLGMHESVSRFFENLICRSRAYIHAIYPKFKELFKEEFNDVSEEELYEAVNLVTPSLIRTEADEVTYSLHVIIRYELEKKMINENLSLDSLKDEWNKLYKEYLGVDVDKDSNGILQDVHWCDSYGYFPTYALGNGYNAAYFEAMKKDINVDEYIAEGNFEPVLNWLKEHVFSKACIQTPNVWIKEITGQELSAKPFLKYLNEKYSKIYKF